MPPLYLPRLAALQSQLQPHQAILCSDPHDITYFSGFQSLLPEEREAFLVVTKRDAFLLYASFSPLPSPLEVKALPGVSLHHLAEHFAFIRQQVALKELLLDKTKLYTTEFEALAQIPNLHLSSFDKKNIWQIRSVKDTAEVAHLRLAGQIAARGHAQLLPQIKVGMTEIDVQLLLEKEMSQLGSHQPGFPTIVAFGAGSALPHYQPSTKKLTDNTPILIDFGAMINGYRSDITRTFWFGKQPSQTFIKLKKIVDQAYVTVLRVFKEKKQAGQTVTAADLDIAARKLITEAGYGSQFIHTTGHGVGLDIHEPPSISGYNPTPLELNMVITVEPGIYLTNECGYRYENTVLVTDSELVELTAI